MDPVAPPPKLLDRLRHACRVRHLSPRTEDAYHGWCRRFVLFHGKRHPREMGVPEINQFLTHLAVDRQVSASTQNQAFNALLFLYPGGAGGAAGATHRGRPGDPAEAAADGPHPRRGRAGAGAVGAAPTG